jgi:hypothetical protein
VSVVAVKFGASVPSYDVNTLTNLSLPINSRTLYVDWRVWRPKN